MACFAAGTLVWMADGSQKAIERVWIGDLILEQRMGQEQVVNIWRGMEDTLYQVQTMTGRTIRATGSHPFLTNAGWKRTEKLQAGDMVQTVDGQECIAAVKMQSYEGMIYNLETEQANRLICNGFIVGDFVQQNEKM